MVIEFVGGITGSSIYRNPVALNLADAIAIYPDSFGEHRTIIMFSARVTFCVLTPYPEVLAAYKKAKEQPK